jgi:hypothetical protein
MNVYIYSLLSAPLLFACSLNETLYPVGPLVTNDPVNVSDCGPNEIADELNGDKLVAIPANSAFGLGAGTNRYYPTTERMAIRTYGLEQPESDYARHGASLADFWSEGTRSYNTWNSAEANVHITIDDTYWPACDVHYTGGSDECWFGGTVCTEYRNTNVVGTRVCEVWRVKLNIQSMYLFVDSRGLSRENIVVSVAAHEVGHTMGLRHRSGTHMATGTPIPGYNGRTWETMPRFDDCQVDTLLDYVVDSSSEVIYMPVPESCL